MVRAIQVNSLGFVDWLLSRRPGLVISLTLHAALLLFLAFVLAFPPGDPAMPEEKATSLEMVDPIIPPAKPQEIAPVFEPKAIPTLDRVTATVREIPLPPSRDLSRQRPTLVTTEEPRKLVAPAPVVVVANPISRGGLFYPERAAARGLPGYVDFSFTIEPDGSVGDPRVVAEVPEGYGFAAAAQKAFPSWRFKPMLIDGKPAPAPATIRIRFQPRDR